MTTLSADLRVPVCEPIAEAGVADLSERFSVDDGVGLLRDELMERVADYDALAGRSATKVTADMIEGRPA